MPTATVTESIVSPFESDVDHSPGCRVDQLVFAELDRRGLRPAPLCSDAVFVRRIYIDLIGTLPTSTEVIAFLSDDSPTKHVDLVEELFERDEFADYWAMKWCDILRVKSEFPVNLWPMAAQAYHRWIRSAIRDNMPYDRFVRELLTASGSNFRDPAVNFYRSVPGRQPEAIARYVALTFMGERTEKWPRTRLQAMAPFFSQIAFKSTDEWKEEIVIWDPAKESAWAAGAFETEAAFPDGTKAEFSPCRDPRETFADWLTDPANPSLARNIVNRIWCWLFGRGIIHEPDDIRGDNPPSNPALLAYLERVLRYAHFDPRSVYRAILKSKTYRLSSIARSDAPEAQSLFAYYPARRMDAEVLLDAVNQISGAGDDYSSAIPEPFTFLPPNQRAVDLPDGSIGSPFLELFGRPGRDTGLVSERDNRVTVFQRLHLLNSSHIRAKIEQIPAHLGIAAGAGPTDEVLNEITLSVLSRLPTDAERAAASDHAAQSGLDPRAALIDIIWATMSSAEFLFRH
jgi:hypothetical protein